MEALLAPSAGNSISSAGEGAPTPGDSSVSGGEGDVGDGDGDGDGDAAGDGETETPAALLSFAHASLLLRPASKAGVL